METRVLAAGAGAVERIPKRKLAVKTGAFIPVTLENFISQKEGRIKSAENWGHNTNFRISRFSPGNPADSNNSETCIVSPIQFLRTMFGVPCLSALTSRPKVLFDYKTAISEEASGLIGRPGSRSTDAKEFEDIKENWRWTLSFQRYQAGRTFWASSNVRLRIPQFLGRPPD